MNAHDSHPNGDASASTTNDPRRADVSGLTSRKCAKERAPGPTPPVTSTAGGIQRRTVLEPPSIAVPDVVARSVARVWARILSREFPADTIKVTVNGITVAVTPRDRRQDTGVSDAPSAQNSREQS